MESSRSEKIKSIRENRNYAKKKNYGGKRTVENIYRKEMVSLKLIIVFALFIIVMIFNYVDNDFVNKAKEKIDEFLIYNEKVVEFWDEKLQKLPFNINIQTSQENQTQQTQQTTQESQTKLVPTLED